MGFFGYILTLVGLLLLGGLALSALLGPLTLVLSLRKKEVAGSCFLAAMGVTSLLIPVVLWFAFRLQPNDPLSKYFMISFVCGALGALSGIFRLLISLGAHSRLLRAQPRRFNPISHSERP